MNLEHDFASIKTTHAILADMATKAEATWRQMQDAVFENFAERGTKKVTLQVEPSAFVLQVDPSCIKTLLHAIKSKIPDDAAESLRQQVAAQIAEHCGMRTVYAHEQLWASVRKFDDDKQPIEQASLAALGANDDWADLIKPTVNTQSLSARVRELDRDPNNDPILPDDLKNAVNFTIRNEIRVRKA